ncbi:hypothetical protein [Psychroflexus planctonicus]|uniref:Uncharacterized protein n=1 Tax=Psychroflexus planctonicus TaxID=1526575 RepID=A0ABQ1SEA6_9FLAO|nr:hypothetical protein [Psychroflexus planctonicus]GGE26580.1 hypothetical protein GCM10010832_04100 [Psychroflexus planctonicus]
MRYKPLKNEYKIWLVSDDDFFVKSHKKILPKTLGVEVQAFVSYALAKQALTLNTIDLNKTALIVLNLSTISIEDQHSMCLRLQEINKKFNHIMQYAVIIDRKLNQNIIENYLSNFKKVHFINKPLHKMALMPILRKVMPIEYYI